MSRRLIASLLLSVAPLFAKTLANASRKQTGLMQRGPFFAQDIAPIVYARCAPCHHAGGAGPFSLVSYEDVRKHARQIAAVTRSRFMPPWLPLSSARPDLAAPDSTQRDSATGSFEDFADDPRLSAEQIKAISLWVEHGAPPGDLAMVPAPPKVDTGWTLGTPDIVVQASEPFRVPASGPDLFWNYILFPHLSQSRYVRAIEIRPQNAQLIHHANIVIDRTGSIKEGFAGMDVSVPRNPLDFDGNFLFYKPGAMVAPEPEGFSWRLDPGTTLILNTHVRPSGKVEMEQPSIGLYLTGKPPKHLPYLLEMEGDRALDIPAGASNFLVSDDFTLPIDTFVLGIYPHAHYLGKTLEAYATLPDRTRKWLIRIPDWNPGWQSVYRYRKPVRLPAGTVISMRYRYDNSERNPRNPNNPPRRVQGGNQATDEMAHLWLQLLPESAGESRRVYAEAWARHEIEHNPHNHAANMTLGSLALARYDATAAVKPLREAILEDGEDAFAHNLYGTALAAAGRNAEAQVQFETALKLRPDMANARFNLAHSLARAGQKDEAVQNLREILKAYPGDQAATGFLQELLGR